MRDARFFETPVALAILQIVNLAWPSAKSFDRAQGVVCDRRERDPVRGDPVRDNDDRGSGKRDDRHEDAADRHDAADAQPRGPNLGPLGDMIGIVKDELLSLHVGGTLDHPEAQVRSLSGFGNSWRRLFGPAQPAEVPAPPERGRPGSKT